VTCRVSPNRLLPVSERIRVRLPTPGRPWPSWTVSEVVSAARRWELRERYGPCELFNPLSVTRFAPRCSLRSRRRAVQTRRLSTRGPRSPALKLCGRCGGGSCENSMGRAGFSTHGVSRGSRPAVFSAPAATPCKCNFRYGPRRGPFAVRPLATAGEVGGPASRALPRPREPTRVAAGRSR
jgi:hypothetical protein